MTLQFWRPPKKWEMIQIRWGHTLHLLARWLSEQNECQTVDFTLSMASYFLMMRAEWAPHPTSDGKSVEEASCDGSCWPAPYNAQRWWLLGTKLEKLRKLDTSPQFFLLITLNCRHWYLVFLTANILPKQVGRRSEYTSSNYGDFDQSST